jgi:hypothetical protein
VQTFLPGVGALDVYGRGPALVARLTDPDGLVVQGISIPSTEFVESGFIRIPGMTSVAVGSEFSGAVVQVEIMVEFFVGDGQWAVDSHVISISSTSPVVETYAPTVFFDTIRVTITNTNSDLGDDDVVLEELDLSASAATPQSSGPSPGGPSMPRRTASSSFSIGADDIGSIVEFTGSSASTVTIPSAATLGANFWCILKHSGTGATALARRLVISGTLDGVSGPAVYPGDSRILQSNGSVVTSVLLTGGTIEVEASDSPFEFIKPTAARLFDIDLRGGGGGAGCGGLGAASTALSGGGAGGGGASRRASLLSSALAATETITIGAGGLGGATSGDSGAAGGTTSLGSLLRAHGGGGGRFGGTVGAGGGGGGGDNNPGTTSTGVGGGAGGGSFGANGGNSNAPGGSERVGGAGGGAGGYAYDAAGGGGGGGGISAGNGTFAGGATQLFNTSGTNAGGVAPGGTPAPLPPAPSGIPVGMGGPGGASSAGGNGGAGANGQTPGGGGGGGGAAQTGNTPGPGGNGGGGRATLSYGP